jgi:drug/metabolite transporter (DMT)-like permease
MWLVYALLAAIIWGLSYALDERVFKYHLSPLTLLACISLGGGIIFSILAYFFKLKADVSLLFHDRKALWILLAAVATANIGSFFITISIQAKNATLAALVELSYPLFTILFSLLIFKVNYFTPKVIIGGLLIMIGVTLISWKSS